MLVQPDSPGSVNFRLIVQAVLFIKRLKNKKKKRSNSLTASDHNISQIFRNDVMDSDESTKSGVRRLMEWSFEDTSTFYYVWTFIIFCGCLYNLIMIIIMVFDEVFLNFHNPWLIFNLVFDLFFLLDIFILTRREIIEDGVRISNNKDVFLHRIRQKTFVLDIICVLPFDLLLFLKSDLSVTRLNRLLKCYRISEFNALTEIRTNFPNFMRVLKLIITCFIIFHWNGCVYFFLGIIYDFEKANIDNWIFSYDKIPNPLFLQCDIFDSSHSNYCNVSLLKPLGIISEKSLDSEIELSNSFWGPKIKEVEFSNFTKQYGLSFYWSALTLVTLGEQPWPNTTFQNSFEIGDTLLGLVIFAVIVGDIGNMVYNMNLKRSQFEEDLDGCKRFMVYRKVHTILQRKAVDYFSYMWTHGGAQVDESEIAEFLPPRLYGQLAVHIHMETLQRVKLFENCNVNLLYELILRLERRVYSPKDYICNKGEVGTEMYIVNKGAVEVVSENGQQVFVQLAEGTVFGELSILNIPGNKNGNRRTANVRSVGYSDLYVLSKNALWESLRQYPDAMESLMKKGKELLAKDNLLDENVEEEEEVDMEADVELQLEQLSAIINKIEKSLDLSEESFRTFGTEAKQKLFGLEEEMFRSLR
ncbi:unnamed protein product [Auanema sp. JU1783]|nr:unnamed protein product [Auanema sp. JU1783]